MSSLEERQHLKELLLTVSGFDDGLALTLGGITGRLYSRIEELERVIEQDSRQAVIESLYADNQVYKRALKFYADIYNHETLLDNEHEFTFIEMDKGEKARQALNGK